MIPDARKSACSWLHKTPNLKWADVVDMLARKLRKTKQQRKHRTND